MDKKPTEQQIPAASEPKHRRWFLDSLNVRRNTRRERKDQKYIYDAVKKDLGYESGLADLFWKKAYYVLRVIWAVLMIPMLGCVLWFTYWLVGNIGDGKFVFQGYTTFLDIVAGDIVITVLGLVAIVVVFLFPNHSDDEPAKSGDVTPIAFPIDLPVKVETADQPQKD